MRLLAIISAVLMAAIFIQPQVLGYQTIDTGIAKLDHDFIRIIKNDITEFRFRIMLRFDREFPVDSRDLFTNIYKKAYGNQEITGIEFYQIEQKVFYEPSYDFINTTHDCSYIDNRTDKLVKQMCWDVERIKLCDIPVSRETATLLDPMGKVFEMGKWYTLEIRAYKKPELGAFAIDIIPKIAGYELPYEWWNSSWSRRVRIDLTNITTYAEGYPLPFYISLNTSKFIYEGWMNSDGSDIRLISPNDDEIPITNISHIVTNNASNTTYAFTAVNGTYYIYFGNPLAAKSTDTGDLTVSNGNATASDCNFSVNTGNITYVVCRGTTTPSSAGIRKIINNSDSAVNIIGANNAFYRTAKQSGQTFSSSAFESFVLINTSAVFRYQITKTVGGITIQQNFTFWQGSPFIEISRTATGTGGADDEFNLFSSESYFTNVETNNQTYQDMLPYVSLETSGIWGSEYSYAHNPSTLNTYINTNPKQPATSSQYAFYIDNAGTPDQMYSLYGYIQNFTQYSGFIGKNMTSALDIAKHVNWSFDYAFQNIESQDSVDPDDNSPADMTIERENTTANIGWILTDNMEAGFFRIYRNGTLQNDTTAWVNNTNIYAYINNSYLGYWNYTIEYNDSSGRNSADTVFVTINPRPLRIIVYDNSSIFEELIGYWPLDFGPHDESGNGHHGKYYGVPTNVTGQYGYANYFASPSSYINLSDDDAFTPSGDFTICAWAKSTDHTGDYIDIAAKTSAYSIGIDEWAFELNDSIRFTLYASDGTYAYESPSDSAVIDEWNFVCAVYSPGNYVRLYNNGSEVSSNESGVPLTVNNNISSLFIGTQPKYGAVSHGLADYIDEVMMFNSSLSATEINSLYHKHFFSNWSLLIENGTVNYSGNFNNTEIIPAVNITGTINITIADDSSVLYYSDYTNTSLSLSTGRQTVVHAKMIMKTNNTISLTSSAGWSTSAGTLSTITCSTSSGTPTLYRGGVVVSNPYTATFAMTSLFTCSISETADYGPNTETRTMLIGVTGFGCTSTNIYAFQKNFTGLDSINWTTLDLTHVVNSGYAKSDLSDVSVNVTYSYTNTSNVGGKYYMIVNTTEIGSIMVSFGNYYVNNSYSNMTNTSDVYNVTGFSEINPYYLFEYYEEMSDESEIPTGCNISVKIYCSGGTTSLDIYDSKFVLATNGTPDEFQTKVTYSATEIYSRWLQVDTSVQTMRWYLTDANENQVLQNIITLEDNTGDFPTPGTLLAVRKYIGGALRDITENIFDVEDKVVVYLINDEKYQLYVSYGGSVRNIGYLYADSADLTKTITINEMVTLNSTILGFNLSVYYDNATDSIVFYMDDPTGQTHNTTLWIYNGTNSSAGLVYYAHTTNSSRIGYTYIVNKSLSYFVRWHVEHSYFGNESIWGSLLLDWAMYAPAFPLAMPFVGTIPGGITWQNMVLTIGLLTLGGAFGAAAGATAGIIVVLAAGVFMVFGWYPLTVAIFVLALAFALMNKMTKHRRNIT